MRVYLAGPIESLGAEEARAWREDAVRMADSTFTSLKLVNPMDFEGDEGPFHTEEIVNTDKYLISTCDALLVDGRPNLAYGTPMEVLLGWQQQKLVVVWGIERDKAPLWMRFHASRFEPTVSAALEYLYDVAGSLA
jgi:hypothetical protein